MKQYIVHSPEETIQFAKEFASHLQLGDTIVLTR